MRQTIKLLWIFTVCMLFFTSVPCFAQTPTFKDVQGHWGEQHISALLERGTISGMSDGLFHPDDIMTFQQYVKIIISSAYGEQPPETGHWASGYMRLALENGVIDEYDMQDSAERNITRFDAARLTLNMLVNVYGEEEEPETIEPDFVDFTSCHSCQSLYNYARQCRVKGIISGRPSPEGLIFDGSSHLTRAEGCTIIAKMLEREPG